MGSTPVTVVTPPAVAAARAMFVAFSKSAVTTASLAPVPVSASTSASVASFFTYPVSVVVASLIVRLGSAGSVESTKIQNYLHLYKKLMALYKHSFLLYLIF